METLQRELFVDMAIPVPELNFSEGKRRLQRQTRMAGYSSIAVPETIINEAPLQEQKRTDVQAGTNEPAFGKAQGVVASIIGTAGLAAAGMSIYHTYSYLLLNGKPDWVSITHYQHGTASTHRPCVDSHAVYVLPATWYHVCLHTEDYVSTHTRPMCRPPHGTMCVFTHRPCGSLHIDHVRFYTLGVMKR